MDSTQPETPAIPVICDRCREEGLAGDDPFTAIRDLLNFDPVKRRMHVNGWTAYHQRAFVAGLAITGSPRQAAAALGRWPAGADQLRKSKGGRSFDDACTAALDLYREREVFRIKDNLAALAEQQEARDETILAQTHLRALPPPSLVGGGGSTRAERERGEGPWDNGHPWHAEPGHSCPTCAADPALAEERRGARAYDKSIRRTRRKIFMCRRLYLATIAGDPECEAAWELLCGPADWDAARAMREQPDEDFRPADITPLQEARWQIPLSNGFAPDLTEPDYDPAADPLQQLGNSIARNDPRGNTERSEQPRSGA